MNGFGCHILNCETCAAIERVSRELHIEVGGPVEPKPSRVLPLKSTTIDLGSGPDHSFLLVMVGVFTLAAIVFLALWAYGGFQ
jgi:hypothetical protein